MRRLSTPAFATVLVSTSAVAAATSGSDTLVVVLEKQSGMREMHSQSITPDYCHAMLQLFKELSEESAPVMLNTLRGSAEALDIFCIEADGQAVDWTGAAVTSEEIERRTDELITERKK